MALKDLYKEKEEDDVVTMELDDFIEEHEKLIRILREGSREELLEEAKKQEKELNEYK